MKNQLTEAQQNKISKIHKVWKMRHLGISQPEIALVMGISVRTIEQYCLQRFKVLYGYEGVIASFEKSPKYINYNSYLSDLRNEYNNLINIIGGNL